MYPKKGRIDVGSDADIVIWNPSSERVISAQTHHHAIDFNIFEGMKVHGNAEITISNGKVVWEDGKLNVEAGAGRFIPISPNCEYVFGSVASREKVNSIMFEIFMFNCIAEHSPDRRRKGNGLLQQQQIAYRSIFSLVSIFRSHKNFLFYYFFLL